MRKETSIAIGVVAIAVALILLGVLWPEPDKEPVSAAPKGDGIEISMDRQTEFKELPGRAVPESYPNEVDDSGEVTRIIIMDSDGDEISDLLSEKVIVNDKVVDQ